VADPRVVGLLMFDGYAFPGRRAQLERQIRRALAAPTNPAVIGKTARWLQRKFSAKAAAAAAPHIFESDPPEVTAAVFRRSMTQVAERNVAVLLFYTGTMHVVDRGRDQLGPFATEAFTQRFEYRFIGDIDHSLTSMESQRVFMEVVCDWALRVVQGTAVASSPHAAPAARANGQFASSRQAVALQRDPVI